MIGLGPVQIGMGSGAGSAVWSPSLLSPLAWYFASATYITESSGAISQWDDRSGNARHLTQSSAASKPTWSASGWASGQGAVSFDGSSDEINTTSALATAANTDGGGSETPISVLAVIRMAANQDGCVAVWEKVGGTARHRCRISDGGPFLRFQITDDSAGEATNDEAVNLSTTTGNVVAWIQDGTTSRLRTDGNTEDTATVNVGAVTADIFRLGASLTGTDIFLNGKIAELVVVAGAVSSTNYGLFRAYAQGTWSGLP